MRALLIALAALFLMPAPTLSHEWYGKKQDPKFHGNCCGENDCDKIDWSQITLEDNGYRIRLTLKEAQVINPEAEFPVDSLVIWDRVQQSDDLNYHVCIFPTDRKLPQSGVRCFFVPPGT